MEGLVVDDPHRDDTEIGPLITGEHRERVEGFVSRAVDAGGTLVTGGGRPSGLDGGFFYEPTLVASIGNEAEISQEELFAPVGVVLPYDDLDEAVSIANHTRFGLNANVWGPTPRRSSSPARSARDRHRQRRRRDESRGALGGYRESGVGRECGEEGYREYFEVKHVQWPVEPPATR